MTFRQLALSNIRGSALRYAAFFLSSVFSVLLFFMYAQFLMHPDLAEGYLYGGDTTRTVLLVCEILVAVFAFFFVLYSSGAFLRARLREFGLLTLLGTTRGQLRRLIWLENSFLSVAAIAVGIALGQLLSKLFLMGISRVLGLEEPIRFMFVPSAMLLTAVGFFLLFQLVTLASAFRIGRQNVVELMRAARRPHSLPHASIWLALLGAALVVGGYVATLSVDGLGVVAAFLPVVAVVVVGTYLLFNHGSVKLLQLVRRGERGYLSGTRMLVVSQLLFRVRDNSRLLATIASLSAVVLAAAGTFYILGRQLSAEVAGIHPQALALIERAEAPEAGSARAQVDALLDRHDVSPSIRMSVRVHELRSRLAGAERETSWLVLVTESEYLSLAEAVGFDPSPSGSVTTFAYQDGIAVLGAPGELRMWPVEAPTAIPAIILSDWYVVPDADLASLPTAGRDYSPATYWLYDWPQARARGAFESELYSVVVAAPAVEVAGRLTADRLVRETFGLSMFAGVFVSVLFFIGAGSLIYFKLFTELEGDRRLFERLRRIGITPAETSKTVTAQVALIFLLPFAVGSVHALVALQALGTLMMANVVQYSLIVIGLFGLVQLGFFVLTRWTYLRALTPAR